MTATLKTNLDGAVDDFDAAAVTSLNAAIVMINATRTAISAALADGGTAAAVKAHIAGEDVTVIAAHPVSTEPLPVTPTTGPAAVPRL